MADIPPSSLEDGVHHETEDAPGVGMVGEQFPCPWYVQVKCRLDGVKKVDRPSAIARLESKVSKLFTSM